MFYITKVLKPFKAFSRSTSQSPSAISSSSTQIRSRKTASEKVRACRLL